MTTPTKNGEDAPQFIVGWHGWAIISLLLIQRSGWLDAQKGFWDGVDDLMQEKCERSMR